MKKKIAILTQPLHDNYGGLLQSYALKEMLSSFGHRVEIINRRKKKPSQIKILASTLKNKVTGREVRKKKLSKQQKNIISENTLAFREKYIPDLSELIISSKKMKELNNKGFDAYVVGSDQCWRPRYSPCITNYFLDFAAHQKNIKRIAYAASFGTSEWEFTPNIFL